MSLLLEKVLILFWNTCWKCQAMLQITEFIKSKLKLLIPIFYLHDLLLCISGIMLSRSRNGDENIFWKSQWNAFSWSKKSNSPLSAREACAQLHLMKWKTLKGEEARIWENCSNRCMLLKHDCHIWGGGNIHSLLDRKMLKDFLGVFLSHQIKASFSNIVVSYWHRFEHACVRCLYKWTWVMLVRQQFWSQPVSLFFSLQHYLPSHPNQRLSLTTVWTTTWLCKTLNGTGGTSPGKYSSNLMFDQISMHFFCVLINISC